VAGVDDCREIKPASKVVDNYSPTLGNIEEFNRSDVFFPLWVRAKLAP
jgi:hypothetical protein